MSDNFRVNRTSCDPAHAYVAGQHYHDELPAGLTVGNPLLYCPFKEPNMQLSWLQGFSGDPFRPLD